MRRYRSTTYTRHSCRSWSYCYSCSTLPRPSGSESKLEQHNWTRSLRINMLMQRFRKRKWLCCDKEAVLSDEESWTLTLESLSNFRRSHPISKGFISASLLAPMCGSPWIPAYSNGSPGSLLVCNQSKNKPTANSRNRPILIMSSTWRRHNLHFGFA